MKNKAKRPVSDQDLGTLMAEIGNLINATAGEGTFEEIPDLVGGIILSVVAETVKDCKNKDDLYKKAERFLKQMDVEKTLQTMLQKTGNFDITNAYRVASRLLT